MFCSFCGKNLDQDVRFCSYCGKEQPASYGAATPEAPMQDVEALRPLQESAAKNTKPAKKTGRSLLFGLIGVVLGAVILAAVFFFTGMITFGAKSNDSAVAKIEGPGYDTPEEAAEAYLTALRDQDVDAMMATFAIESYGENYNFDAMYERMNAYTPTYEMKFPNSNEYNTDLNVETRKASLMNQIAIQYFVYNVPSLEWGLTFSGKSGLVSDIEKDTKHYVFDDLEITGTLSPDDIISNSYDKEKNEKYLLTQSEAYGVDNLKDIANVVITFEADGETWYFCPQLIRYEGRWYVQSLTGNVASLMGMDIAYGGIIRESLIGKESGI